MNDYFIRANWWDGCRARSERSNNFVIAEHPASWLKRQRERMAGTEWVGIQITMCCQLRSDDPAYPPTEPDFTR